MKSWRAFGEIVRELSISHDFPFQFLFGKVVQCFTEGVLVHELLYPAFISSFDSNECV